MRHAAWVVWSLMVMLLGAGCNRVAHYEAEPEAAEHEILSAFQETEEAMRVAWLPSALAQVDEDTLIYADRGTRKILAFSLIDRTISVVADLSPYEGALSDRLSGDSSWGKTLLMLNPSVALLAGPGRRLAIVDTSKGDVFVVGGKEAHLPTHGGVLGEADFSLLTGVGAADDRLFVAFDDRIFSVSLDRTASAASLVEALEKAKLVHEAGDGTTSGRRSEKVFDAQTASLDLPEWTHFLWHEDTLFFWEPPRLMGLRDGRLMDIGGGGWVMHGDDLETTRLYGLDLVPSIHWFDGAICSAAYLSAYLACVSLTELDFEEGRSAGSVSYTYWETPTLDAFVPGEGDEAYGMAWRGGGIWHLHADGEAELLFGLKDEEARFDAALKGDLSVSPKAVVTPLAVVSLYHQIVALSPLLGRLTLSSMKQEGRVTPLWVDLEKAGQVNHIATDGTSVYMVNGSNLERLTLSEQSVTDGVYSSFFKPIMYFGIPGKTLDIRPTMPMKIYANETSLLAYIPQKHWLFQSDGSQVDFAIEPSIAFQFPTTEGGVELVSLNLTHVSHIASDGSVLVMAANEQGSGKIVIANAGKLRRSMAGLLVGGMKARLLSSYGALEAADGINIHDVHLPEIQAISLAADHTVWFISENTLWHIDDGGVLHFVQAFSGVTPTELWVAEKDGQPSIFVRIDGIIKAWQEHPKTWEDTPYQEMAACSDGWIGILGNQIDIYGNSGAVQRIKLPVLAESAFCTSQSIYVSGTDDTGKRGVWRAPFASHDAWERIMGGGYGVPDLATFSNARIGVQVGKILVDSKGTFYAWLKDTCTLWRIDDFAEFSSESIVQRVVSDDRLCSADALDASANGEIVLVDDGGLYRFRNGAFRFVDDVPGACFDLQVIDGEIVAFTEAGLRVYRHDKLHSQLSSPVQIGESWIDFAQPGHATPRFTAYPGERAVIIPVLYGGQIVKLGYE